MKRILFFAFCFLILAGCQTGNPAGHVYHVRVWHYGSSVPLEWYTDEKPIYYAGFAYFKDKKTGMKIRVSGSIIVDEVDVKP